MPYQRKLDEDIRCPLEYGMKVFGGKWNSRIICVLSRWTRSDTASCGEKWATSRDAVLAAALKELIANGVVQRRSYDQIPPRVEYSLTERVKSVVPILQSICQRAGAVYREEDIVPMVQCRKCDYR